MSVESLVIWLIIGALAGFLANYIVQGYGLGTIGNIVVGIIGAFIGSALLPRLGLFTATDIVGQIIAATIGAVILLFLLSFIRRTA